MPPPAAAYKVLEQDVGKPQVNKHYQQVNEPCQQPPVKRRNGKEVGRITETPVKSWEKDMIDIMQGRQYVPKYPVQ